MPALTLFVVSVPAVNSHIEQLGARLLMLVGYVYGAISEEDLDRVIVKCEDDECTGMFSTEPYSTTIRLSPMNLSAIGSALTNVSASLPLKHYLLLLLCTDMLIKPVSRNNIEVGLWC